MKVLSNPRRYGLKLGVWYALNASAALLKKHAEHTLAGRFGVPQEGGTLEQLNATLQASLAAAPTKTRLTQGSIKGALSLSAGDHCFMSHPRVYGSDMAR